MVEAELGFAIVKCLLRRKERKKGTGFNYLTFIVHGQLDNGYAMYDFYLIINQHDKQIGLD